MTRWPVLAFSSGEFQVFTNLEAFILAVFVIKELCSTCC
jgi:hypothetical protein